MKLSSALFDFLGNFKKGADFYRVFRKLSFVNQPGFLWRNSHKNPGFFYFKKGAGSLHPIHSRSPVPRRTGWMESIRFSPMKEFSKRAPDSRKPIPLNTKVLPVCCFLSRRGCQLRWEDLPCGDCKPIRTLVAPGCLTMSRTGSAVLSRSENRNQSNRTVHL